MLCIFYMDSVGSIPVDTAKDDWTLPDETDVFFFFLLWNVMKESVRLWEILVNNKWQWIELSGDSCIGGVFHPFTVRDIQEIEDHGQLRLRHGSDHIKSSSQMGFYSITFYRFSSFRNTCSVNLKPPNGSIVRVVWPFDARTLLTP